MKIITPTTTRARARLPGWAFSLMAVPLIVALFGFAAWLDRDLLADDPLLHSAEYLAGREEGEQAARTHLGEVAQAAYRQGQADALEAVTSIPEGTPLPQICARIAPMLQQVGR